MTTKRTKLNIAHRGLWDEEIPENSLGAFQKCLDANTAIELDVHLLKDGTLVVFHDDDLRRMTGVNKKLKNCTYDEIKGLPLAGTKFTIPTFEEVLTLVDGRVLLDIEIKFDTKNFKICRTLAEQLDSYQGDFIIKSFSPFHIAWFRFKRPNFTRGLLVSRLKNAHLPNIVKRLFYTMKFNFLAAPQFVAFDHRDLPNEKIEKLYERGMPIYLWTIRDGEFQTQYDGIIYENTQNVK